MRPVNSTGQPLPAGPWAVMENGGSGCGLRTKERLSALASFIPVTTRFVSVNSTKRVPTGSAPLVLRRDKPVTPPRSAAVTRPMTFEPRIAPSELRNLAVNAAQSSRAPAPPNQPARA